MTPTLRPEKIVDAPHPLGVASREVIVDGDHVDPASAERIEDRGQRRDQRFALAGFHFGDFALVQHHAADELDIEMALAERALAGLAHRREHRREQILQRLVLAFALFDRGQAGAPFGDLRAQLVVGKLLEFSLQPVDLVDVGPQALNFTVVLRAEDLPPYR